MNKLETAVKLLQILNERKVINSKVISKELNVSLRTAQRYLRELAALPCVINGTNNTDYEICADYKLKEALLNSSLCELVANKLVANLEPSSMNEVFCLLCGGTRDKLAHSLFVFKSDSPDLTEKLNQLVSSIRDMLSSRQCTFPE